MTASIGVSSPSVGENATRRPEASTRSLSILVESGSRGSNPTIASNASVVSATSRAIGAMTDIPKNGSANPGPYGMAPYDGLNPTTPTCAGGRRLDPPASVPIASGTTSTATAVAGPPDEPPGVSSVLSGCRVGPKSGDVVTPLQA